MTNEEIISQLERLHFGYDRIWSNEAVEKEIWPVLAPLSFAIGERVVTKVLDNFNLLPTPVAFVKVVREVNACSAEARAKRDAKARDEEAKEEKWKEQAQAGGLRIAQMTSKLVEAVQSGKMKRQTFLDSLDKLHKMYPQAGWQKVWIHFHAKWEKAGADLNGIMQMETKPCEGGEGKTIFGKMKAELSTLPPSE